MPRTRASPNVWSQLDREVPIEVAIDDFAVCAPDPKTLVPFLKTMEFGGLLKRAAAKLGIDDPDLLAGMPAAATAPAGVSSPPCRRRRPTRAVPAR